MDERDAAYELLLELEQTLSSARGRLADLALLAAGGAPPGAAAPRLRAPDLQAPEVLPSAQELCAEVVPDPLVLPAEVEAPAVVVPGGEVTTADEDATADEGALSAR